MLVHGPHSWACAVRTDDGDLEGGRAAQAVRAARVTNPVLRGPVRLADVFALLPQVKHALPEAELPSRVRACCSHVRHRCGVASVRQLADAPARAAAERPARSRRPHSRFVAATSRHTTVRSTSHRQLRAWDRPSEGARALRVAPGRADAPDDSPGNLAAERAPRRYRSAAGATATLGSLAASMEIFGWMTRYPAHPVSPAPAKPGDEPSTASRNARADGRATRGRRGCAPRLTGVRGRA